MSNQTPVEALARWRRQVDQAYMSRVAESVGHFIRSGLPPAWLRAPEALSDGGRVSVPIHHGREQAA